MQSEFGFELPAFEIAPTLADEADEWGRRPPFAGRRGPGAAATRPGRRRPLPQARRHGPGPRVYRRAPALFPEPFPVAATTGGPGSERIRWVQDCLNQALGLQLPVTGVMGPATRSALRSFQQRQGLRVSGLAGPDTQDALKAACAGPGVGAVDGSEGGADPAGQTEIGPLTATLTWLPNNRAPRLYTRAQAATQDGGGVYIVLDAADGRLLKVGKADHFRSRFTDADYLRDLPDQTGLGPAVPAARLRFYLGRLPARVDPYIHIERALARLLLRSGEPLAGSRPVADNPVSGRVRIRNILPKPLADRLARAYGAPAGRDPRGQRIPAGRAPAADPRSDNTLLLEPAAFPRWELAPPPGPGLAPAGTQPPRGGAHGSRCRCRQCRWASRSFP